MNARRMNFDVVLLAVIIALTGIGLVMVYSSSSMVSNEKFGSSSFLVIRHLLRLLLGFAGMFVAMNLDYHRWAKMDRLLLGFSLFCLVFLIVSPTVHPVNGAKRWLQLGFFSFQPSELAKIMLVIFMARSLSEKRDTMGSFTEGLLPHLALLGVAVGLVAVEPNFSTAFAIMAIILTMIYVSGARLHHVAALGIVAIPVLYYLLLHAPYRHARVTAFMGTSAGGQQAAGYQAYQALISLGSGGIFGSGLGASRQKLFYLPEPYTDFVFAILGEELGFIGAIAVLALFCMLAWRGIRTALRAPDFYGTLLGFGITAMIVVYALFHVGVSTSLLPTTGIPLPFISYGGVSLVFTMVAVGILLNISGQCGAPGFQNTEEQQNKMLYRHDELRQRKTAGRPNGALFGFHREE